METGYYHVNYQFDGATYDTIVEVRAGQVYALAGVQNMSLQDWMNTVQLQALARINLESLKDE